MSEVTMGGLFSGEGGFELAGSWAGIETLWSNDFDKRRCRSLEQNFNHKVICKSIKEIDAKELESVDIICGGDPCQPSSRAGLGRGKKDDRFLWPEMLRIIKEVRPFAILNENVDGTITNGILDLKIDDLESQGYTCQPYCIPASAVGALHRRDRVWLVAVDSNIHLSDRIPGEIQGPDGQTQLQEREQLQLTGEPVDLWPFGSYPDTQRLQEQYLSSESEVFQEGLSRYFGFGSAPHGHITRDIIESGVMGMLNGLPEGMDYPDRNGRIAGMGNAIVPQVAYEFLWWMKEIILQHKQTKNEV